MQSAGCRAGLTHAVPWPAWTPHAHQLDALCWSCCPPYAPAVLCLHCEWTRGATLCTRQAAGRPEPACSSCGMHQLARRLSDGQQCNVLPSCRSCSQMQSDGTQALHEPSMQGRHWTCGSRRHPCVPKAELDWLCTQIEQPSPHHIVVVSDTSHGQLANQQKGAVATNMHQGKETLPGKAACQAAPLEAQPPATAIRSATCSTHQQTA